MANKKQLAIYQAKNGAIELREDFDNETIWATQKQIAEIFDVDRTVIVKHIKNIFSDKELDQKVVCANFAHTTKHGAIEGKMQTRTVNFYNLDIILAVGYRTNSVRAIEFRRWANKILGQYITKGYLINPQRIGKNYDNFLTAVEHVQKLLPKDHTIKTDDILELIKTFAGTWFSLEAYDEDRLPHKGVTKKDVSLRASDLYSAVGDLKKDLIAKKQASDLFAQEKQEKNLEGILGNVLQSAFGADMYPSIEEKAAHLLYFVVKNHPFNDGNKRTGAFAFVWFLHKTGIDFQKKITPESLTTITLLVAESKPRDKDRMIGLILLLLNGK
ncbi:MAG: RhuM family protein [Parcubacteria group bacterium]|jgi:death-on-curing family protein